MGLRMLELFDIGTVLSHENKPFGYRLKLISGSVFAANIRKNKFIYDFLGDAVSTAGRTESIGDVDIL